VILARAWRLSKQIEAGAASNPDLRNGQWLDAWRLRPVFTAVIREQNLGQPMSGRYDEQMPDIIGALLHGARLPLGSSAGGNKSPAWLDDPEVQRAIGVNEHEGTTYFNRERFLNTIEWLAVPAMEHDPSPKRTAPTQIALKTVEELAATAQRSGYRLDEFRRMLSEAPKWVSTQPVNANTSPANGPASKSAPKPDSKRAKK
jgi:hypothetical protein